jgi:hypothetical protein
MATQPDPMPDIITPQSPQETPIPHGPSEMPGTDLPGVSEPAPDYDQPGTAPPEAPMPEMTCNNRTLVFSPLAPKGS